MCWFVLPGELIGGRPGLVALEDSTFLCIVISYLLKDLDSGIPKHQILDNIARSFDLLVLIFVSAVKV